MVPREHYDIGIVTVLPVELEAVLHHLGIPRAAPRIYRQSKIFSEAAVFSSIHQRVLRVIIGCIGQASQADAVLLTKAIFTEFDPAITVSAKRSARPFLSATA